jgi:predicted TIM-barrel fold metal-dependent hydrolase
MLIADSQVHIWAPDTPERPWPPPCEPYPHRAEPLTGDSLLKEMDAAGVDRALLTAPTWEGPRNDVVLAAADAHPERFAVMGRIDIEMPAPPGVIETWLQRRGMLGIRFTVHRTQQRECFVRGGLDWLWPRAEKAGVPIMLFARHEDSHIVDAIAERHPALKLGLDHLGLTDGKDDQAFRNLDLLLGLARRPNVAVKLSCLPIYTGDAYPFRRLHPYLRPVHDAFGAERLFWGTDFSRLPCSYREAVTMFTDEMPWLPPKDLELIMGRALCEWLRWEI